MTGLNKVQLIGNLGRDPEVRRSGAGNPIVNFSVATSETWKDKQTGERKEKTEWHNVVVFNEALAKVVEQYVKKGSKIYIEGKMRTRKWQDKDGADKYTTEVVLENFNGTIVLLDSKDSGNRPPPADQSSYGETRQSSAQPRSLQSDIDDDIPF